MIEHPKIPDEPHMPRHNSVALARDQWSRPLRSLRLSVTDRCNLRCQYCMPEKDYVWLPRKDLLSFEEIERLVGVFTELGVDKLRLTGGEPLLRNDLPDLIARLAQNPRLSDIAVTTNGVLLSDQLEQLTQSGLHRLTVSLDTLDPQRFREISKRDQWDQVVEGIRAASRAGFRELKLDTVVTRGFNDDECVALIEFSRQVGAEQRFIEYMDVGGATRWSMERVVSKQELLGTIEHAYGPAEPIELDSWAPARRYRLSDGTVFGIIASTTEPFCATCDRSRLTADGMWYLCLYASQGHDLREVLRDGVDAKHLAETIQEIWRTRRDRGAFDRWNDTHRKPVSIENLRQDPHLEMHTRGG